MSILSANHALLAAEQSRSKTGGEMDSPSVWAPSSHSKTCRNPAWDRLLGRTVTMMGLVYTDEGGVAAQPHRSNCSIIHCHL